MAKSGSHPMGILLSSQQLHEVEKVADHVILIKKGKAFFNTGNVEQVKSYALEIETLATRENLLALLNDEKVQVQYNGGFYTIVSETHTVNEMISLLINGNITITYFRDITHSTKRYF
jgi:ABC-2 type transport system ATP-binding protein